jgi:hypothetical protein
MTLIRLIRALLDPAVTSSPWVLGVDEFALRKGHSYGTLLVGGETRRPVDILDRRSSESFAAWQARPGTELICRDRGGCYADGAAQGAPDAIQVADRWHLWRNLGEAVERGVARHREHLAAAVAVLVPAPPVAVTAPEPAPQPDAPRIGPIADRTRRRHAEIQQMLASGHDLSEIATALGLARNTVRRFARAASPGELPVRDGTGQRPSILDEHVPYLREPWNSGCTNAAQLWQEIRDHGYPGSRRQVRAYLAHSRGNALIPAPAPAPPKVRTVTSWIMTNPDQLTDDDKARLDAILAASPELAAVTASVRPSQRS